MHVQTNTSSYVGCVAVPHHMFDDLRIIFRTKPNKSPFLAEKSGVNVPMMEAAAVDSSMLSLSSSSDLLDVHVAKCSNILFSVAAGSSYRGTFP